MSQSSVCLSLVSTSYLSSLRFCSETLVAAISKWFASARFFGWKSFEYKHKPDVKCLQYKCILYFSVFLLSPFFCLKASVAAIGSPLIYRACYSLSHWPAAVSIVVESSTVPNLWLKNTTDKYLLFGQVCAIAVIDWSLSSNASLIYKALQYFSLAFLVVSPKHCQSFIGGTNLLSVTRTSLWFFSFLCLSTFPF